MDKTSALLFNYSKAAGLLSKSFVNERTPLLFQQNSLADLWTLLFKSPSPMIPEVLLAKEIEREAFKKFINQYEYFLKQFDNPPEILVNQFRRYEVENLKEICDSLSSGERNMPELIDLLGYSVLKTENWPNLGAITEGTAYGWLNKVPDIHHQQQVEFKLDLQLLQETWNSIQKCSGENKIAHEKLFLEEFQMKNILWALRLSIYYGMDKETVIKNLLYITDSPNRKDPLAAPAIKVLDLSPDKYSDWENWKYKNLLNPYENIQNWRIEPSWIEKCGMIERVKHAFAIFHQYPMEDVALVAWFKIKTYELNCIRTAVESLRLNVSSQEAMEIAGIHLSEK